MIVIFSVKEVFIKKGFTYHYYLNKNLMFGTSPYEILTYNEF